MGKESKIQWTHATHNPWIGCSKVSPGCTNCYAAVSYVVKMKGIEWGPGKARYRTKSTEKDMRALNREAVGLNYRPRVFCASLSDWLDDDGVPIEWLADLMVLIYDTPNLDWLLLTKRPENFDKRISAARNWLTSIHFDVAEWLNDWLNKPEVSGEQPGVQQLCERPTEGGKPPSNVWIGTTVENQEYAEKRIPELLKIPARVRFLSCEPLLGPIDLGKVEAWRTAETGMLKDGEKAKLDLEWVIVGGESGKGARPFNIDWARDIVKQCRAAGVACFCKQVGTVAAKENGLVDKKGGEIEQWPWDDIKVREFPHAI